MKEQLYLSLGCFGCWDDDFVNCNGIENIILCVEHNLVHYHEIMNYFDAHCLFDQPIFDYNAIRHFIFKLQNELGEFNHKLWSEKKFVLYEKFTIDHKRCGLYLKLILLEPKEKKLPKEKSILIPAKNSLKELPINQSSAILRLIQKRR